jgi:hypothetical protein
MPRGLSTALRLYKGLSLAFLAVYVPLVVYDDFVFIEKISSISALGDFLWVELVWFVVYFFGFSLYYWIGAGVIVTGLSLGARARGTSPSPDEALAPAKAAPSAGNTPDRTG